MTLQQAYKLVDQRDNKKCVLCEYLSSKDYQGDRLSVMTSKNHVYGAFGTEHHHIRGRKGTLKTNIDNIITLCKYHHDQVGNNRHPETNLRFEKVGITSGIRLYLDEVLRWQKETQND